jgi:hypothetical protein
MKERERERFIITKKYLIFSVNAYDLLLNLWTWSNKMTYIGNRPVYQVNQACLLDQKMRILAVA